jgi:hypothetical protein
MSKIPIIAIALLVAALMITPVIFSVAQSGDRTPIDIQREKIEDLEAKVKALEARNREATQKLAKIDALIKQYQDNLAKTTQQITAQYEKQLEQLKAEHAAKEKAYESKLIANSDLSELSLKATQQNEEDSQKLLTELRTSGKEVKKLTEAVSVSEDGNVKIGRFVDFPNQNSPGNVGVGNLNLIINHESLAKIQHSGLAVINSGYVSLSAVDGSLELGSGNDHLSFIDFKGKEHLTSDYEGRIIFGHGLFQIIGGNVKIHKHLDVNGNIKAKSFEGQIKKFSMPDATLEPDSADKHFHGDNNCQMGTITAAEELEAASICVCVDGEKGKGWYCFN